MNPDPTQPIAVIRGQVYGEAEVVLRTSWGRHRIFMAPGYKLTVQCSLLAERAEGGCDIGIEAVLTGDGKERLSIGSEAGIKPEQ